MASIIHTNTNIHSTDRSEKYSLKTGNRETDSNLSKLLIAL